MKKKFTRISTGAYWAERREGRWIVGSEDIEIMDFPLYIKGKHIFKIVNAIEDTVLGAYEYYKDKQNQDSLNRKLDFQGGRS